MAVRRLSLLWKSSRTLMSNISERNLTTKDNRASSIMAMKIALIVAVPAGSYLAWKYFIVDEEVQHSEDTFFLRLYKLLPGDGQAPEGKEVIEKPRWNAFERLWLDFWHEDPEECDRQRFKHLRRMEKRRENYLRKKAEAIDKEVPLQPMDLFTEIKHAPLNRRDSGMEN